MPQTIQTAAGTGEAGYSGDGGPAANALMREPFMCAFDRDGNLFVCEATNHIVRKIDAATGVITTIAGTGEPGYSGDNGPATQATMREPNDCFLDGSGGLLIADIQDQRVRRLDLESGLISTFAGNGEKERAGDGLPATQASILGARAVCMDNAGNTYIAEREGNGVRVVTPDGIMGTIAGTGELGYTGDGGPAIQSTWAGPKGIRCDRDGNIIVTDTENHAIRKIDAATRVVTTIAGGRLGPHGDGGPATEAGLERPHGCEISADGALYIADSNNHRVRVVS